MPEELEAAQVVASPQEQTRSEDHHLARNAVSFIQSAVISVANTAPTASAAVALPALIIASGRGGIFSMAIVTVAMLAIAWSFARFNRLDPSCGALYVWLGRMAGPTLGFVVGWVVLCANLVGTISTALPTGPTVLAVLGLDAGNQFGAAALGALLIVVVATLAIVGMKLTARLQLWMAIVEFGIIATFAAIGLFDTFIAHPDGFVQPSWDWLSPSGVGGQGSVTAAMFIGIFLIAGWDSAIYVNEETVEPERNPGKAVLVSVALLGVVFMVLITAFQGVGSLAQFGAHQEVGLDFVGERLAGSTGAKFMDIAVLLSVVATAQVGLVVLSRLSMAMSADRLLPGVFGNVHPRFRTPAAATAIAALGIIAVLVASIYSSSVASAFETIVSCAGFLFALYYAITALAAAWYYRATWRHGAREMATLVLMIAAAAFLLWNCEKAFVEFTPGVLWTIAGLAALGCLVGLAAKLVARSPYFDQRREPLGVTDAGETATPR